MKYWLILPLLLFPLKSFAYLDIKSTLSYTSRDYLLHRSSHSLNDQETLTADFNLTYDNEKNFKLVLDPRIKTDFFDHDRDRFIPLESYFEIYSPHLEGTAGLELIRWGAANSYNPTDVINRKDFEDYYYNPERLGEVMTTFQGTIDQAGPLSELTFFAALLPFFQEAPLPGNDTRFALEGSSSGISFSLLDDAETQKYPQAIGGAVKISATMDNADLSLHYYHGPDRDPGFVFVIDSNGALRLRPFYYLVDMAGLNFSFPVHDFNFHLEAAAFFTTFNDPKPNDIPIGNNGNNNQVPDNYVTYVPGIDYTFHNVGNGDFKLTAEYLGEPNQSTSLADFRPFKNDVFFGIQYDFDNTRFTEIKMGIIKDVSNKEWVAKGELSTKIYKELKLNFEGTVVQRDSSAQSPISIFENNSNLMLGLSYTLGGRYQDSELLPNHQRIRYRKK